MTEEVLFVPSPRLLPLEDLRREIEAFVEKAEPEDAPRAAQALEALLRRTPNPVNLRQEPLRSGGVLALVLVEPLATLGNEGFLLGSFLHARYAHPSPLGLLLAHEAGRAHLEELTKRTREVVPELPRGLFPRWFQVGLLRFVEDPLGRVRFVQAPFGLLRADGESPLLTRGEVQRSGDLRLARALWKRSGEAVPLRLLLKLVKGEELTGEEVSEGRKALALAELAGL